MQGNFEILSLAGSYLLSESGGMSSRTGGLSVSLSGPDGRVLGGAVAGPLTAASPVQVPLFFWLHIAFDLIKIFTKYTMISHISEPSIFFLSHALLCHEYAYYHKMWTVSYMVPFFCFWNWPWEPYKSPNGLCFCYRAVQVVIGSFLSDGKLELDPGSTPDKTVFGGFPTASSPSSRGTESSGGHGSPPNPAASFNTGSQPSFPNFPTWKWAYLNPTVRLPQLWGLDLNCCFRYSWRNLVVFRLKCRLLSCNVPFGLVW